MKKKQVLVVVLVLLLLAGVSAGGVYAYQHYQSDKKTVKVYPVSMLDWGSGDSISYSSGTVTDDHSQTIYLEGDQMVEEVYVSEGDDVKEGDPLFRYNVEEANLNLEMKQLELSTAENDLLLAQRELERLKKTVPIPDNPPESDEPLDATDLEDPTDTEYQDEDTQGLGTEIERLEEKTGDAYNIISKSAKPYAGKGTDEEPYRFLCTQKARVLGEYLNLLKKKSKTAIFEIHKDNQVKGAILNAWLVNGSSLEQECDPTAEWSVALRGPAEDEPAQDDANAEDPGADAENPGADAEDPGQDAEDSEEEEFLDEPEGYTASELASMIADQQKEIREMDLSKRKLALEVEALQQASNDGIVKATVDGYVASVQDPNDQLDEGAPFVEIRGEEGLYVTGALSELLLEQIKVGQVVTINSWQSGMSFQGTITEISNTPTDNMGYWGEGNPNVSYYPYTAKVEDSEGLQAGEEVDLSIDPSANGQNTPCIEKAYVREEGAKSYVYIEDENGKLKKQYVKTGKVLYGQAIQILSGLDKESYIAFPYGKGVKEGVKAEESEELEY